MPKTVTNYDLQWKPATNQYAIWVKFSDGSSHQVPVSSAEEFIAITLLLQHSPVVLRDDGTLEYKS